MLKLKRILLIAPGEMTLTPAFERACALACAGGALLHIVAFDYVPVLAAAGLFAPEAMARAREGYLQVHRHWLEQQARFKRCIGLNVTTEVVWARSNLAHVLEYVNDFHPDLVVKDTHCVPALDRAFHRSLDWRLLRECPAHLHLVTRAGHARPMKILVAVDLSHLEALTRGLNDRLLDLACRLAADCGAALHLLNVGCWAVMDEGAASVPTGSLDDSLKDAIEDAQQEAFEALAERYGIPSSCRHLLTGVPRKVIGLFARQHAFDMVVLGMLYPDGKHRLIGSTVESLLNQAACSLMIVKSPQPSD